MKSVIALSMINLNLEIKKPEFIRLDKKARYLYMLSIRRHSKYKQVHVVIKKRFEKDLAHKYQPKESWSSFVNFSQSRMKSKENCQVMIKSDAM